MSKYMSIHIHTREGSTRDALLSVEGLYEFLKKNNISGSITDHGTLGAWASALSLKKKYPDVKIALGIEVYTNKDRDRLFFLRSEIKKRKEAKDTSIELKMLIEEFEMIKKYNHLVVLAKNNHGLHNIIQLNNQAYRNFYEKPLLTHTELFDLPKDKSGDRGIIVTSACLAGVIPQYILKDKVSNAFEMAGIFKEEFNKDYYLELQINGLDIQKKVNSELLTISKKLKIPNIISTDSHYESEDFNKAHEIFLLIQGNQKVSDLGKEVYKFTFENKKGELKKKKFDPEDLFRNTKVSKVKIGDKFSKTDKVSKKEEKYDVQIKNIEKVSKVWTIETNLVLKTETELDKSRRKLGHDEISKKKLEECFSFNKEIESKIESDIDINRDLKIPRFKNEDKTLKEICARKLIEKKLNKPEYIERVKHELKVIIECQFASYFLILYDLFQYLKQEEIAFGSGRGSVSGSLVAYLLGISRIDPLDIKQYGEGLVFERFLDYGRSGKKKYIELTLDSGEIKKFNIDEEILIKRNNKKLKIKAIDLKEEDDIE